MFQLRFPLSEIDHWAGRYPAIDDEPIEDGIAPAVQKRGYFTKPEFVTICHWKTPRSRPKIAANSAEFIEAVTRVAFSTSNEQLRIEVLTLLQGVSWPTASVLLHFGHAEQYPILDYRALWSLGIDPAPTYQFEFWWAYTSFCRELADTSGVSMRQLDRALWMYSKENQGKAK